MSNEMGNGAPLNFTLCGEMEYMWGVIRGETYLDSQFLRSWFGLTNTE